MTENQKKYNANYQKQNIRQFIIKANKLLEPELIAWMESQENIQQYIKALVREDMEKHQPRT